MSSIKYTSERIKRDSRALSPLAFEGIGNPYILAFKPWKPKEAHAKSNGGRWLCMECCCYQRGSKVKHKGLCPGSTVVRTRAK
jgi:hypothetical protein